MKTLGIIPSRFASSRFPGKPLVEIGGKSMIRRVYEQAQKAQLLDELVVATDDERIFNHVKDFGGNVVMTDAQHQSGTDRCAEVAGMQNQFSLVVNVQGDEPFLAPEQIDRVVKPFLNNPEVQIATLAKPIEQIEDLFNPNIVKVVIREDRHALYFSRSCIPHIREGGLKEDSHFKHIGLYAFRRAVLMKLSILPLGKMEQIEKLEQLRWLENGFSIMVERTEQETIGIDTPEDLEKVKDMI